MNGERWIKSDAHDSIMKSYLNKNFNFNEYLFTILFEFENKIHITKNNIVFQFIAPDFKKKEEKKKISSKWFKKNH